MFFYYDWTIIILIPAMILSLWAQTNVNGTFRKYSKVFSRQGYTGFDAARRILDMNGLYNVKIERVSGNLTDHFDPKANVVRLSDATYSDTSVGAIGVAAHECGHAIQYATNYAPIKLRNSIVPVVNIGNTLSMPLFFIGLIMGLTELALVGALLFGLVLIFQLITLPVEFNASSRAIRILEQTNILDNEEIKGSKKVLKAAAMTYVAAVAATALQLLRLLMIVNRRRD